jgi:glycosyltransferase involved in cell wall biosynthesis
LRILHVSASYLPAVRYGGTIVSVHALCRALSARGHEVHVYTTSVDGGTDSPVPHGQAVMMDGVHVWYFRSRTLRRFYFAPDMADAADAAITSFDVVHSHAMYLWPGWAMARRAGRAGVPYVIAPRGMLEKNLIEQKNPLAKAILIGLFERRLLERAAAIHVTSAREAAELERFGFTLPPVYDVPNGVDEITAPCEDRDVPDAIRAAVADGPYVLFLGRISWKKGLDRLIAALPYAPAVRVIVAGNDDEDQTPRLSAIAARLGVADRIHFVGPVYDGVKAWLLSRAAFMILPSYSENFGNVVLESLAHGRPVLLTPEVGLAETIAARGAGVIAGGSPAALGGAIAALAASPDQQREMGRRGLALVEHEFGWAAVAARVEAIYRDVSVTRVAS